jgi:chlorobactene glucosyltransferase
VIAPPGLLLLLLLLQSWHELDFSLGSPEDIEYFPWSAVAASVVIVLVLFFFWKGRRNYMALPELPALSGVETASQVTAVIPARNEQGNIARCVKSLAGSARVIVVDDGSTDSTAKMARNSGAEVIEAPRLPKGVMGKVNAMLTGAKHVTTPYILFVDADTSYLPGFLPAAASYASANETVLLSAFLKQQTDTLFEKMLVPYAFGLYFCGVSAKRVNNALASEYLANGQCMLFLRSAYEFLGGHMVVADSVVEDVAMAQKVKRHRMKVLMVRAEHLGRVRMYQSLGDIWRGFRKNSFHFFRLNPWTGVQVMFASILLTSLAPVSVWLAMEEQWPFLAALLLTPVVALRPWYGSLGAAVLALPAIYLFQLIALDGMLAAIFHRKTDWKGRKV